MESSSAGVKLYAMHGGGFLADKSLLTSGRDIGTEIVIPFQFFLVEHPDGRLLFDTGCNPLIARDPANYPATAAGAPYRVSEEDLVENRLAEIGLTPADIHLVANSHLHDDHAGGNVCFPHATFLVQFDELRSAWWGGSHERGNYIRAAYDLPTSYEELDGDHDVFADGSVVLIKTPGHTAGHQSLVVRLEESGTIVLAADAAYFAESHEEGLVPRWVWSPRELIRSYKRLHELRHAEGATIVPSHDLALWETMRKAPDFYA